MSEIKVGQIYKSNLTSAIRTIAFIDDEEVSIINIDGLVDRWKLDEIPIGDWKLLAEYPTWQEAVDSEYFKND